MKIEGKYRVKGTGETGKYTIVDPHGGLVRFILVLGVAVAMLTAVVAIAVIVFISQGAMFAIAAMVILIIGTIVAANYLSGPAFVKDVDHETH